MKPRNKIAMSLLAVVLLSCIGASATIFVDKDAVGTNDGSSWANAFTMIQPAVNLAPSGEEVWIAEGVYDEPRVSDTDGSVVMKAGVGIYGGFRGSEAQREQRNWSVHVTVIHGSNGRGLGQPAYHVTKGANGATLDGLTITGGRADDGDPSSVEIEDRGGGMFNRSCSPIIKNCTFSMNFASWGGGMYNLESASPTVMRCSFVQNTAGDSTGMCNDVECSPDVSDCTFVDNTSTTTAGMGNWWASSPHVTNCVFVRNHTTGSGGAMLNWSSCNPVVVGCLFVDNSALKRGGAIYNNDNSSPQIRNCRFETCNAAIDGGAIYNDHSSPTIEDCSFSGNQAAYDGGAVLSDYSSPSFKRCHFISNSSGDNGGGVFNWRQCTVSLVNCVFAQNQARSGVGGGIFNCGAASAEVVNCTLALNRAESSGAGMFNGIAGSTQEPASANVVNSIVFLNSPDQISTDAQSSCTMTYSDVQGGYAGQGNIDLDPRFANVSNCDLHLLSDSPCVDRGTTSGAPGTDVLGVVRPQGQGIDLGAYEFQPSVSCSDRIELIDEEWDALKSHLSLGAEPVDVDGDGLPEQWALRLVALILCDARWPYQLVHDEVYAAYTQNLLALEQESPVVQPYKDVLAALLLMGMDLRSEFITRLGLTGSYTVFMGEKMNAKSPYEPFSGAGDIDHDAISNADEYAEVVSYGGSIDTFAQVALYWPGAGPLPVAGIIGLGALASVIALVGAHRVRRIAQRR